MRLLLGSGGLDSTERVEAWIQAARETLGSARRAVFIPYASGDPDQHTEVARRILLPEGVEITSLHRCTVPVEEVRNAQAILTGGGNTFRLLRALYRLKLLPSLREAVKRGVPYLGVSAGSNIACPTICTTNDMPIVAPPRLAALGLVPFQINPHYFDGPTFYRSGEQMVRHGGESRDQRLSEFQEENDHTVVGLREGSALAVSIRTARLVGPMGARIFVKGQPPIEWPPGSDVSFLMQRATQAGRRRRSPNVS